MKQTSLLLSLTLPRRAVAEDAGDEARGEGSGGARLYSPARTSRTVRSKTSAAQFPTVAKQADLAYLGTDGVETPHRKPRGGALTETERAENRLLAATRVHVEHGIRRVKGFKIVRDNYRHPGGLFPMVVSAVVGLVHLNRIFL